MRIDRLQLKGLTTFVEPIDLDLRDVPPGIIAVVGPNGAGKTTLLEAMFAGWYGEMPSRGDRQLFDLVNGTKDAFIDVEATLDGRGTYRGRTALDGLGRKRSATLMLVDGQGTPQILNDGKATTFDAAVATALPPKAVLLASAFAAQNKAGSFATASKRDRKDLFAQLLGLEQLETMAQTARTAAGLVEQRRNELQAQLGIVRPLAAAADALGAQEVALRSDLQAAEQALAAAIAEHARLDQAVAEARTRVQDAQAARARHGHLVSTRADREAARQQLVVQEADQAVVIETQRQSIARRRDQAIAAAEAALQALPSAAALEAELARALAEIDTRDAARRAELEERITNNQTLIDRHDAIVAAGAALEALDQAIRTADAEHLRLNGVVDDQVQQGIKARDQVQALQHWPADLDRALTAAALLERVPFGARCAEAGCEFVAGAVAAQQSIEACRAGVAAYEAAVAHRQTIETAYLAAKSDRADAFKRAQTLRDQLDRDHRTTRADLADLQAAHARLEIHVKNLVAARIDAERERKEAREARVTREAEVAGRRQEWERAIRTADETAAADLRTLDEQATHTANHLQRERLLADAALDTIDAELGALAETMATLLRHEQDQIALGQELATAREAVVAAERARTMAETQLEAVIRRRAEAAGHVATAAQLEASIRGLETDVIEWQALGRVFGREGLPVLEIDAAGPGVSALANDLLQACFGGRFSVELVTQQAKAGGKGLKEAFELQIYDAERGGDARDLSDLSGGEQVIVDEALKSSLAAFVNLRSTMPIRTVWRDESAGALDPENGPRYMAMLRRLHERCGLHHLFLVVHDPSLAAMADAQIVVANGTVRLVYPPFNRSEAA